MVYKNANCDKSGQSPVQSDPPHRWGDRKKSEDRGREETMGVWTVERRKEDEEEGRKMQLLYCHVVILYIKWRVHFDCLFILISNMTNVFW